MIRAVEELKGRINALTATDKARVAAIYEQVFGRPFRRGGCGDCYRDALIEIYHRLKKQGNMNKCNYRLKNGPVLRSPSFPEIVTNDNLTDKLAEKFLRENSARIGFFATYPDDWQERIKPKARKKADKTE